MEKTFEELIDETPLAELLSVPEKDMVKQLMQQVCEATIAECKDKIWNEYGIYQKAHEIQSEFDNLPTDRIKTEK